MPGGSPTTAACAGSPRWPGVRAYERLGYALCGADTLYYGSYMPNETALYLAKPLR